MVLVFVFIDSMVLVAWQIIDPMYLEIYELPERVSSRKDKHFILILTSTTIGFVFLGEAS